MSKKNPDYNPSWELLSNRDSSQHISEGDRRSYIISHDPAQAINLRYYLTKNKINILDGIGNYTTRILVSKKEIEIIGPFLSFSRSVMREE